MLIAKFGDPVSVSALEMKFVCPECGYKSLTTSLETGVYFCFICEFGRHKPSVFGTKVQFKKRDIDFNLHLDVCQWLHDNLTLSPAHKNWLFKRGIYQPERFGLRTIPVRVEMKLRKDFSDRELIESGFYKQGYTNDLTGWPCLKHNRLYIPIVNDGQILGCKTRCDPRQELFEEVVYAVPTGGKTNNIVSYYPGIYKDIIISEGEIKIMSSAQLGYPSVGTSGINGLTAAFKFFTQHKEFQTRRKFIVFDTEADEAKVVSRIQAYKLANFLGNTAAIVTLPRLKPRTKTDLDLFILQREVDFEDLLEYSWYNREKKMKQEHEALYENR